MYHHTKHLFKLVVEVRYGDDIDDIIRKSFFFESSEEAQLSAAKILEAFPAAEFHLCGMFIL